MRFWCELDVTDWELRLTGTSQGNYPTRHTRNVCRILCQSTWFPLWSVCTPDKFKRTAFTTYRSHNVGSWKFRKICFGKKTTHCGTYESMNGFSNSNKYSTYTCVNLHYNGKRNIAVKVLTGSCRRATLVRVKPFWLQCSKVGAPTEPETTEYGRWQSSTAPQRQKWTDIRLDHERLRLQLVHECDCGHFGLKYG